MTIEDLTIGQTITIVPAVTFSADRDTEAGAQPWKATVVGRIADSVIIEDSYSPNGVRLINKNRVFEVAGQAAYR